MLAFFVTGIIFVFVVDCWRLDNHPFVVDGCTASDWQEEVWTSSSSLLLNDV